MSCFAERARWPARSFLWYTRASRQIVYTHSSAFRRPGDVAHIFLGNVLVQAIPYQPQIPIGASRVRDEGKTFVVALTFPRTSAT